MRFFAFSLLTLAVGLTACDQSAAEADDTAFVADGQPRATLVDNHAVATNSLADSQNAAAAASAPPPDKGGAYRLVGIKDPELGMVAFALKVPREWKVEQKFWRDRSSNMPTNKVYLGLRSPDGSQQIEYLPVMNYGYMEGPSGDQTRAQLQALGMGNQMNPSNMPPMPAREYLSQYLLPELARNGLELSKLGNERSTAPHREENRQLSSASVDGVLADGTKVRVEVIMVEIEMPMNSDTFHSWSVAPSVTRATNDLAAAYAHTKVAQESMVNNPTWVRQNNELANRTAESNTRAQQQAHEQRMADMRRAGEASTARFNQRMADMDRNQAAFEQRMNRQSQQNERFIDNVIQGETKYVDPSTGERTKLSNQYNNVYSDRQGNYYGSDTPLDADRLDWQQLQEVPADAY